MHYQYSPLGNPESFWDVRSNGNLSFYPSDLQPFKNKNAHRGPDLPRNQAFWNGPHPMIYNGEKGHCPNPRQLNQEFTPGTYSDKLSPFCNSRPYSRSSDYLVHPTHSTGSSNSFSNSYEPTLQRSFGGLPIHWSTSPNPLGSPTREHESFSFQPTTSRNDMPVNPSSTNSPWTEGFSSSNALHQASERLLKAQNLAKRQRAHAERVSTFQISFTSKNDKNNAYTINLQAENNHELGSQTNLFEQFTTNTPSLPSTSHTPQPQVNPYNQDASSLGVAAFYSGSGNYSVPVSI